MHPFAKGNSKLLSEVNRSVSLNTCILCGPNKQVSVFLSGPKHAFWYTINLPYVNHNYNAFSCVSLPAIASGYYLGLLSWFVIVLD